MTADKKELLKHLNKVMELFKSHGITNVIIAPADYADVKVATSELLKAFEAKK